MAKDQKSLNSGPSKRALEERIRKYVEHASKGQVFTVEEVSNAVRIKDCGFVENNLIRYAYNEELEKQGNKFIKKNYSDKDIFNNVLWEISRYGHFQPNLFLEQYKDIQEERLTEVLKKGRTELGWVIKNEDGVDVYFMPARK